MGLLYEVLVMIPVLGVYYVVAKPGVVTVILSLLITLVLSVFILTLSTVLGWVVALVSSKMKNKSMLLFVKKYCQICHIYDIYGSIFLFGTLFAIWMADQINTIIRYIKYKTKEL